MRNLFYLFIFLVITSISCSHDEYYGNKEMELAGKASRPLPEILSSDEMQSLLRLKGNNRIDIDEVQKQVLSFVGSNPENSILKGQSDNLRISNSNTLWKISEVTLKDGSVANDSIPIYVFNFANDKTDSAGYVIASGDVRVEGVLANSLSGKLSTEISNPGLAIFLSNAPDYIDQKIEESKQQNDSIYNSAVNKINENLPDSIRQYITKGFFDYRVENYSTGNWQSVRSYNPIINLDWDQGNPYNKNLDYIFCDGAKVPASTGCAATALAQIMAFHKYPSSINGTIFDWKWMTENPQAWNISPEAQDQVANLMKYIGLGVKTTYDCSGSGAKIVNVNDWIKKWYDTDGVVDYDIQVIINSLLKNRPVFITGYAIKKETKHGWWIFSNTSTSYEEGHAFVIDGYIRKQRPINYDLSLYVGNKRMAIQHVSYNESNDYVRCNLGWYGTDDDGYYLSGVFDTKTGTAFKSGTPYFFQYNLEIIPNIRRK